MIARMKFVNITGPKDDIDRVVSKYLSRYPIHLENALSELNTADELMPFVEDNPYRDTAHQLEGIVKTVNDNSLDVTPARFVSLEEAAALAHELLEKGQELKRKQDELVSQKEHLEEVLRKASPFMQADMDLHQIFNFKFIKYRFGRISLEYFDKFSKYVYDNLNTIFYECSRDEQYVWGVYFAPESSFVKVEAVFASMHFERIYIPEEFDGPVEETAHKLKSAYHQVKKDIDHCQAQLAGIYDSRKQDICDAYASMYQLNENFDIRKKAACTKERQEVFYILCGWMEAKIARKFQKAADGDKDLYVIIEDDHNNVTSRPPTKMKNRSVFKPFQMFISMYGLPAYNEIDPTKFVALTYALMFGIMFGDVGQGACLVLGGFLLYRFKHMAIAGIISFCGLFSVFFGFMYGSVFGFEEVLHAVWLKPMESENMMTVLILAVVFGVILILIAMIINMINAVRAKSPGRVLFGTNGLTGFLFYIAVLYIVVTKMLPALGPTRFMGVLVVVIAVCLIGIGFAEPLQAIVEKQKHHIEEGPFMFVLQTFFELFEIVLSFMTNTISFIRVGAFALSHAGMMSVVMMLSNIETGATPVGIIIVVFGNILIAGLEGLIVGIQVLRLEYYEMFSRFYSGNGRQFEPYKPKTLFKSAAKHMPLTRRLN